MKPNTIKTWQETRQRIQASKDEADGRRLSLGTKIERMSVGFSDDGDQVSMEADGVFLLLTAAEFLATQKHLEEVGFLPTPDPKPEKREPQMCKVLAAYKAQILDDLASVETLCPHARDVAFKAQRIVNTTFGDAPQDDDQKFLDWWLGKTK